MEQETTDLLQLQLQGVVFRLLQVVGIELGSSDRAMHMPNQ